MAIIGGLDVHRSQITEAGPAPVRGDVASLLGVEDGAQAFVRRRLVANPGGEPQELVTHYFPVLVKPANRPDQRTVSLISARMPSPAEAEALAMPAGVPLLAMLLATYDQDDDPIQVMETLWPADRYSVSDEYPSGQPVAADEVKLNAPKRRRMPATAEPRSAAEAAGQADAELAIDAEDGGASR